jgi:hypothetical protein
VFRRGEVENPNDKPKKPPETAKIELLGQKLGKISFKNKF